MDRSSLILTFAILALFIANVKFGELTYFHPLRIVLLNLLGLSAAIAFFVAYSQRQKPIKLNLKTGGIVLLIVVLFFFAISFESVGLSVLISIAALFLLGYYSKRMKLHGTRLYTAAILVVVIAFIAVYPLLHNLRGSWKGIDEIAYNYYASYLLLHGTNPYTVSMLPILNKYNITPTYLLNGSVETAYDYPAFSFLPVIFIGLFNLHDFVSFVGIVVFLSLAIATIIYRKSNYSTIALVPIGVWLLVTYIFFGTIDQYISVALFLLLAYTERKNAMLSGIFMGLSASTIQLSWFALPFFFILIFREKGKGALLKALSLALIVFLIANSYFIITAPSHFFANILGLFGTSQLLLEGTNVMQLFVRSYGVTLWYPAVLSLVVLAVLMAMFYIYTATLKSLIVIAPAFIFMLSWHNFLLYSLPFVPLMIVLCYENKKETLRDMTRKRSYIYVIFAALMAFSVVLAVYAHSIYVSENRISLGNASVSLYRASNGTYGFNSISINVTNGGNSTENVTFFLVTEQTGVDAIFRSVYLNGTPSHSSKTYTLPYEMSNLTGSTGIYVMAFSSDYIRGTEYAIDTQLGTVTKAG